MIRHTRSCLLALVPLLLLICVSPASAGDDTWTTTGPFGARIRNIFIDPSDSLTLYATISNGPVTVMKSTDGGTQWTASSIGIPANNEVSWTHGMVSLGDVLYLATEKGIYASLDQGATWLDKSKINLVENEGRIQAWSITADPVQDILYVGAYGCSQNYISSCPGGGVFRSDDGGDTWERLIGFPVTAPVADIMVAPSAPHIIYAAGDFGIYRSTDSGANWTVAHNGFISAPSVNRIEVDANDSGVVYMATQSGQQFFRTSNGGQSWQPVGNGLTLDVRAITIDPGDQQTLYVGGGADLGVPGVYRSLDNQGGSWEAMTNGMGSHVVWGLAMNSNTPRTIYAATFSGVWQYTVTGENRDFAVTINDGEIYTNNRDVTLRLTAPTSFSEVQVSNDGGFAGAVWEPLHSSKSWTLTSIDGSVLPRTVYVKFRSGSTISGVYQDDIVLDATSPEGSVSITTTVTESTSRIAASVTQTGTSSLFLPALFRDHRPGFRSVKLMLQASDNLSGVERVLIASDPDFIEEDWRPYVAEQLWWVPEEEIATVYVKYRDRAGNESVVYTASESGQH